MFQFETAEQSEIRASVRKAARERIPQYRTEENYQTVPAGLLSELAALGLCGLSISEEYGGIAASPTTCMLVMDELAQADLGPAIFVSVHSMVSGLIQRFGTAAQKQRFLPRMAEGAVLGAYGLTEPSAGSDAANLATSARQIDGGRFVLNGSKCFITSAGFAQVYVIFARTGEPGGSGISAFLVEPGTPGFEISPPEKKMGAELSPIASLAFDDCELPASALLGEIGKGYSIALSGLAGGRINVAAAANGISKAAIDLAVEHLKERKQFGKALIEFQGLQFMLADMKMKLEAAELLTWQAAHELERSPSSRQNRLFPSLAKCFATDAAMQISTDAVQLMGGNGYIKDFQAERLMREAKMLQIVEGANQIQRMLIAREMAS